MGAMATAVPDAALRPGREPSAPWTVADLAAMPDDGLRYEIIDGALVVSPSPTPLHQLVGAELHFQLRLAAPHSLRVLEAPMDRTLKLSAYAAAGVPQYWIVDPGLHGAEPSIEVYDLIDDPGTAGAAYRLQGQAIGGETLHVTGAVSITVIPSSLIR